MRKEAKQWGNSVVIVLSPEERRLHDQIEAGDILEITIIKIIKKEVKNGRK